MQRKPESVWTWTYNLIIVQQLLYKISDTLLALNLMSQNTSMFIRRMFKHAFFLNIYKHNALTIELSWSPEPQNINPHIDAVFFLDSSNSCIWILPSFRPVNLNSISVTVAPLKNCTPRCWKGYHWIDEKYCVYRWIYVSQI